MQENAILMQLVLLKSGCTSMWTCIQSPSRTVKTSNIQVLAAIYLLLLQEIKLHIETLHTKDDIMYKHEHIDMMYKFHVHTHTHLPQKCVPNCTEKATFFKKYPMY